MRVLIDQLTLEDIAQLAAFDRIYGLPDAWELCQARAVINLHNGFAKRGGEIRYPIAAHDRKPLTNEQAMMQLKALAALHA